MGRSAARRRPDNFGTRGRRPLRRTARMGTRAAQARAGGRQNLRPRHHRHERLHRAMPRRLANARFIAAQAAAGVRLHCERGSRLPRRQKRRARAQTNPGRNAGPAAGVDRRADFVGSVARAQKHRVVRRNRPRHRRPQRRTGPRRQRDRRDGPRHRHDRPLSAGAGGASGRPSTRRFFPTRRTTC